MEPRDRYDLRREDSHPGTGDCENIGDQMQDVVLAVFGVTALLGIVSLILPLANRLSVPYTVVLAVLGLGLGALASSDISIGGPLGDFLHALESFNLSSDAFFYVFLPTLLFNAALRVDVRRLMDDVWPVFLLAVVAVIVCTAVVGFAVNAVSGFELLACLLLGAIVATTDSAAVVAIFRDIGAPQRLTIIVEGESLLNDAAAIVIFWLLLNMITGVQEPTIAGATWAFLKGLIGGLIVGFVAARIFVVIIGALRDLILAEITLTLTLAYSAFIVSNVYFDVSGVVAVVTAAMVLSSEGRTRITPGAWGNLLQTWRQLDFWGTSLIFTFAAMLAPRALAELQIADIRLIAVVFVGTLVARIIVLYGIMPAFNMLGVARPVSNRYNAVLIWGGLRGAMTVALALAISENTMLSDEIRRFVFVLAVGYVLCTLVLQAPTLRWLIKLLGLNELSAREGVVRDRVMALSRERIRTKVGAVAHDMGLGSVFDTGNAMRGVSEATDTRAAALDTKDGLRAGLLTLANREGELYLDYFQRGLLDRRIADMMRAESGRLLDRTKLRGPEGYISASLRSYAISRKFRRALWIQRRFHLQAPLESAIADRFETLLVTGFVISDLRGINRELINPLLGEEVASALERILADREAATQSALEALELQYPAYADSLRARYLERMALEYEDAEYKAQFNQSMISSEIYEDLQEGRRNRQRTLDQRPSLDLGLKLQMMIKNVEFFRELDDKGTRALVRLLYPELAVPGERIIAEGEKGDCMYFIASGEVEVILPQTTIELKQGDVFGEIALVTNELRTADVTAKGYVTLLVLRRKDFQVLTRSVPRLKKHIEKIADQRMDSNARPAM